MLDKIHLFKKKQIIKDFSHFIFFVALIIEIIAVLLDKCDYINPFEGRMFQVSFLLFFFKILLTKYSKKEYAILFFFLMLGLLIDYCGNRNEIFRFVTFIFACNGIEIKKGFKIIFWVQSVGCLIIAMASLLGIFGAVTVEKEYQGIGFITRYCFGMGNANSFHTMFFVSVLLGIYIYNDLIRYWGYISLIILNFVLFLFTDCKTATGLTFLVILVFWISKYVNKDKTELSKYIIKGTIIINGLLLALSIYFAAGARGYCKYYWDSFWEDPPNPPYLLIFFDKLLTGRILSLTEYDYHGTIESWNWFTVPDHNVYFDLGWVRLFYWYGIIPAIVIIFVIFYLLLWLYKNNKTDELLLASFVLFHMFVEAHFVSVYIGRSYLLLMIGVLLPNIIDCPKGKKICDE